MIKTSSEWRKNPKAPLIFTALFCDLTHEIIFYKKGFAGGTKRQYSLHCFRTFLVPVI